MPVKNSARICSEAFESRFMGVTLASCLGCILLLWVAAEAGAASFTNAGAITIPAQGNATPYPSPIAVSGLTGTTVKVNVTLTGFSHTTSGDVVVVLVPPRGNNILFMGGVGGDTSTTNANLTFDDAAAASLPAAGPFATGSYKPTARLLGGASFPAPGPGTAFCNPGPVAGGAPCTEPAGGAALAGALNGFDPNGTWNLYVRDANAGDAGSISGGWTLDITDGGPAERSLVVNNVLTGSGNFAASGTVTGTGINCGGDCASTYTDGASVVLTATPATDSNFAGFTSGCDSVAGSTCTVSINAARTVTATFNPNPPQDLTINKDGAGIGIVTGTRINCGTDCTESYNGGTTVVLNATPTTVGSRFERFTGCDSVLGNTCTVALTASKFVTATFKLGGDPAQAPTPSPTPTPTPTLTPIPTPTPFRDTTPPTVTLSGVPSSMSVKAFLRGVKARVARNEASSIDATLDGSAKKATLAAAFNVSLASRAVARGTGTSTITLKPSKKLVGRVKKLKARVRVVVTDVAGNRRTVTKTIKVKG